MAGLGARGERGAGCGALSSRRWRPSAGGAPAGVRGAGREPPSGVSPGLRLSARSDPGPSALPSLPGTRGRPRLPPAPELGAPSARLLARRRARSRAARPSQESGLAPRRGPQGELDRFAGAGSGRGGDGGRWEPAALGQGVLGKGRQRRHAPAAASRAGARRIFVLHLWGCACGFVFIGGSACGVGLAGSNREDVRLGGFGERVSLPVLCCCLFCCFVLFVG